MAISDDHGVESLAGIMGGAASGCSEDTVDVFIESAYWDPITIAATGRALKINSDARYRFERGVDPAFTLDGLELATRMVLDLCGGEASECERWRYSRHRAQLHVRPRAHRVAGGHGHPEATQRATLEARLHAERGSGQPAKLAARCAGRGRPGRGNRARRVADQAGRQAPAAPASRRATRHPDAAANPRARRAADAGGLGYNECVTYSFIDADSAALFGGGADATRLQNPISSEMTHMRPDLLPGLLQAAVRNQARGAMDLALFEVGPAFSGGEPGEQHVQATAILVGANAARDPHGSRRAVDLYDAKADAEAVLSAIGAPLPKCRSTAPCPAGSIRGGRVSCRWGRNCRWRSLASCTRALSGITG